MSRKKSQIYAISKCLHNFYRNFYTQISEVILTAIHPLFVSPCSLFHTKFTYTIRCLFSLVIISSLSIIDPDRSRDSIDCEQLPSDLPWKGMERLNCLYPGMSTK